MDLVTPKRRSEIMSLIGARNTRPERVVRRLLHRLGYRFRLHDPNLAGTPDVIVAAERTAIFVHGCFWHGCSRCDRGTRVPKTHRTFWQRKVRENRARDRRVGKALKVSGWRVVVIWACQTTDEARLTKVLARAFPNSAQR